MQLCRGRQCGVDCAKYHPGIDENLDAVILGVSSRSFPNDLGKRVEPSQASFFSVYMRLPESSVHRILLTTPAGVYIEPRGNQMTTVRVEAGGGSADPIPSMPLPFQVVALGLANSNLEESGWCSGAACHVAEKNHRCAGCSCQFQCVWRQVTTWSRQVLRPVCGPWCRTSVSVSPDKPLAKVGHWCSALKVQTNNLQIYMPHARHKSPWVTNQPAPMWPSHPQMWTHESTGWIRPGFAQQTQQCSHRPWGPSGTCQRRHFVCAQRGASQEASYGHWSRWWLSLRASWDLSPLKLKQQMDNPCSGSNRQEADSQKLRLWCKKRRTMSRPHARAIQQLSNTVQNTERAVGEARNTLTFISRNFTPLAPACSNFNVAIKLVKDELSNSVMNSFNQQYGKLEALLEKRRKTKCLWHSSFKPGSAWKPTKCSRPSYFFLLFTFLNLLGISTSLYHFISRFYHVSSATLVDREMGSEMQPDYVRARPSAQDFKNKGKPVTQDLLVQE